MTRTSCYAGALLLGCLATLGPAQVITVSPLKAAPRGGNGGCWVDTGGRLKNNCSTTELLTFPVDQSLVNKTVTSYMYTDAPFAKLKCQHASLDPLLVANYWAVYHSSTNGSATSGGGSSVYLPPWKVPYYLYQIDCQVPPGVQVLGALVSWH